MNVSVVLMRFPLSKVFLLLSFLFNRCVFCLFLLQVFKRARARACVCMCMCVCVCVFSLMFFFLK